MNSSAIKANSLPHVMRIPAVTPLISLPLLAYALFHDSPAWQLMWMLGISVYAGIKWLTFDACPAAQNASLSRAVTYLFLWPGMDAKNFFDLNRDGNLPLFSEWLQAISKLVFGLGLVFLGVPVVDDYPFVAGWVGLTGLAFILNFGFFHLLSLCYRRGGIDAEPIMKAPILASSLSDFWGRRWNLAFRDFVFDTIFRPLVSRVGTAKAAFAVFLFSGLSHDLVISVPARGGWGRPTIYFMLQFLGLLLERSPFGSRVGLRNGVLGRCYCGLVVVGPVSLLFHEPFIRNCILPTLSALRTI